MKIIIYKMKRNEIKIKKFLFKYNNLHNPGIANNNKNKNKLKKKQVFFIRF